MRKIKRLKRSAAPELPLDIVEDILLGLPIKSLVRFRYVSRQLFSLIASPQFRSKHPERGTQRILFSELRKHSLLQSCDLDGNKFSFDGVVDKHIVRIVGSSNGLICFTLDGNFRAFCLLNPSTRDRRNLPINPDHQRITYVHGYGFGFDSGSDDCKVVLVHERDYYYYEKSKQVWIAIYSSRSNSWKWKSGGINGSDLDVISKIGSVSLNGAIHWGKAQGIIAFDLKKEEFFKVSTPTPQFLLFANFGEIGGCLSFVYQQADNDYGTERSDLWVMKEYQVQQSWTKLFSVTRDVLSSIDRFHPLCVSKNDTFMFLRNKNKLEKFDNEGKYLQALFLSGLQEAIPYTVTLESPYYDDRLY